jgi:MFS family permease
MSLYAVENIEEAFSVTREFLTPIGVRRWLKLAFIVFFVGSGVSFPTVQFNSSTPTGDVSNGDIPFNVPVNAPVDIVTLIVALVAAGVLLGALFALIGAIMEFVLIESLRTGEVSIRRYWRRRWRQGLRLFVFRVAIGLPILALFAGWVALLIAPIVTGSDPTVPLTAFFVGIPVVFLISVLYALVSGLTTVFVVPLMVQTDDGVLAAWGRLWGSIKAAWKQYLAYVVIAFLLTIAAGIIASIAIGIIAIAFLVPILIAAAVTHVTVSLSSTAGLIVLGGLALLFGLSMFVVWLLAQVPIVTYLRYYALLVLGDIEDSFDILADRQPSTEER